jgi:phosphatidyl-myo-inositol dimannoside synthase
MSRRVVALVTDAFGGRGGIAAYNRYLLQAACRFPGVEEVLALPRVISYELEPLPANLRYRTDAAGGKLRYAAAVAALAAEPRRGADLILCGHLHLLPFARLLGQRFRCPVLPVVYGLEAWTPTSHASVNLLCRRIDAFVSIRKYTAERLKRWAGIPDARFFYLPNCVDLASFGPGPKRPDLVARYGLANRTVIMTAGRMDSSEKNKGFDEVIAALPAMSEDLPDAVYLAMGDGDDRPRLEQKARALGVADRLVFAGYVSEAEKADHYRLADVIAMPGSDPTYDRYPYRFAFLEPLACGIPVVGSRLDDPAERDDADARQLLTQVDPHDPLDIKRGILAALARRGRGIDPVLRKFTYDAFECNAHDILTEMLACETR